MPTSAPYEHAVKVPTGGFFQDGLRNEEVSKTGDDFFEPSPIIIGSKSGILVWFTGIINMSLHVVCLVTTFIAGYSYLNADGKLTQYHEKDYITDITWVYLVCEILAVLWTLVWFSFVYRAQEFAPAAHLGLGLQLLSTVSATLLSYYVMMAPKTVNQVAGSNTTYNADHRPSGVDDCVIWSMYFGWLVIAGYIMTPISGVYLKSKSKPVA